MGEVHSWIRTDETAKRMLCRVLRDRSVLLLPPLHRVPLRAGNVVEITGTSPCAKTQILIQSAISCILPKEWNGIHYGGLGKMVLFLDLDCRFDVLRLAEMLKCRLVEANRLGNGAWWQLQESNLRKNVSENKKSKAVFDEELYISCIKRFLYVRCYDSLELLSTLKTLHYRIKREEEKYGIQVGVLMIDSIGAFHWTDRLSSSFTKEEHNRKNMSLKNVVETIVQEMKKLLQVHSMIVIATKTTIFGDKAQQLPFREFMPPSWQAFVTHRIILRNSADESLVTKEKSCTVYYTLEWIQPQLSCLDKFVLEEGGIVYVP